MKEVYDMMFRNVWLHSVCLIYDMLLHIMRDIRAVQRYVRRVWRDALCML